MVRKSLFIFTEFANTVDLSDNRRIFGTAGFEKLGNTRQTAGDVAGLGSTARDLGDQLTCRDSILVIDEDVGAGRDRIDTHDLTLAITDDDLRMEFLFMLDNNALNNPGHGIFFALIGGPFDQIFKGNLTLGFGDDGDGIRIPCRHDRTLGDSLHRRQKPTLYLAAKDDVQTHGRIHC